jgi:hypothetical protein
MGTQLLLQFFRRMLPFEKTRYVARGAGRVQHARHEHQTVVASVYERLGRVRCLKSGKLEALSVKIIGPPPTSLFPQKTIELNR